MSNNGFMEFGFGENDGNVTKDKKRFKMEANTTARISIAWWPIKDGKLDLDAPTPRFIGAPRHYMKGVGFFINKGPEYTKIAGEPPKVRVATIIVKWPMSAGKLDKAAIAAGQFEMLTWIFDEGKYEQLKPIHDEWNMGQCDLLIKCPSDGAQFQKMSFSPCKESLLRKIMESDGMKGFADQIVGEVTNIAASIKDSIGREMTLDQIREKIAAGGGAPGGGGSGGGPTGDAASTAEIDSLVDDLLA